MFGTKEMEMLNRIEQLGPKFGEAPLRNTTALVAAGSVLFFAAEKGRNPKVNDLFDAMVYCSTCLSVGYGDIFAKTPAGKLLGSTLMTIGPAVAAKALDGKPAADRSGEMAATLQKILDVLKTEKEKKSTQSVG